MPALVTGVSHAQTSPWLSAITQCEKSASLTKYARVGLQLLVFANTRINKYAYEKQGLWGPKWLSKLGETTLNSRARDLRWLIRLVLLWFSKKGHGQKHGLDPSHRGLIPSFFNSTSQQNTKIWLKPACSHSVGQSLVYDSVKINRLSERKVFGNVDS